MGALYFFQSQDALLQTILDRRCEMRTVTCWAIGRECEKVAGRFVQLFLTQLVKVWPRKTFAVIALHGRVRSIMMFFWLATGDMEVIVELGTGSEMRVDTEQSLVECCNSGEGAGEDRSCKGCGDNSSY